MTAIGERKPFFERLKTSLEEGVRFARGELNLQTTVLPQQPPAATKPKIPATDATRIDTDQTSRRVLRRHEEI